MSMGDTQEKDRERRQEDEDSKGTMVLLNEKWGPITCVLQGLRVRTEQSHALSVHEWMIYQLTVWLNAVIAIVITTIALVITGQQE